MKSLVIFDLDGTLLDTIADLGTAANQALSKRGFPIHPIERYKTFVGNGVRKLIERALGEAGTDANLVDEVLMDFKAYYIEHKTDLSRPYPGILALLEELKKRGIRMAVASNKFQAATEGLVKFFFPAGTFDVILGQRDGIPVKPHPQIVFDVLSQIPTPKDQILYVGDTSIDMHTASAAGVESVGVTWGFRSCEELRQSGACYVVQDPSEIISHLS